MFIRHAFSLCTAIKYITVRILFNVTFCMVLNIKTYTMLTLLYLSKC